MRRNTNAVGLRAAVNDGFEKALVASIGVFLLACLCGAVTAIAGVHHRVPPVADACAAFAAGAMIAAVLCAFALEATRP